MIVVSDVLEPFNRSRQHSVKYLEGPWCDAPPWPHRIFVQVIFIKRSKTMGDLPLPLNVQKLKMFQRSSLTL